MGVRNEPLLRQKFPKKNGPERPKSRVRGHSRRHGWTRIEILVRLDSVMLIFDHSRPVSCPKRQKAHWNTICWWCPTTHMCWCPPTTSCGGVHPPKKAGGGFAPPGPPLNLGGLRPPNPLRIGGLRPPNPLVGVASLRDPCKPPEMVDFPTRLNRTGRVGKSTKSKRSGWEIN